MKQKNTKTFNKKPLHIIIDSDDQKLLEKRKNEQRKKIALSAYKEEQENLKKRAYTSFGKMILAEEKTEPIYGIGTEERFGYSNGFLSNKKSNQTPAPNAYLTTDPEKYKYKTTSKWKIGTSNRKPLSVNERYAYYNHLYSEKDDISKMKKKWNKPLGGSIGTEPRIRYNFREGNPGPGRYDPSLKLTKTKFPSYYLGERTNFNDPMIVHTGNNKNVGPGKYTISPSDKLRSTWTNFPKYSIGKGNRKPLYNKSWAKNETYYMYSSFGGQIQTRKRTEPRAKEGKSTRFGESKRGVFRSMMERQPMSIRIAMPKF